jgi:hypothetical protein
MSGTLIDKIAAAAGIEWDNGASGRTDGGKTPGFISYVAVGRYKDLSGTTQTIMGSYEIDFDAWRDEAFQKKLDTWDNSFVWETGRDGRRHKTDKWVRPWNALADETREQFAERCATKDMIQLRKNASRRAETGARNRAVCKALGIKRGGYLQADLATKPIIVCRLVADVDWANDPQAHAALIMAESGLAGMLSRQPGGIAQAMREMLPAPARASMPALEVGQDTRVAGAVAALPHELVHEDEEGDLERQEAVQGAGEGQAVAGPASEVEDAGDEDFPGTPEEFAQRGTQEQFESLEWQHQLEVMTVLLRTRKRKESDALTSENLAEASEDVIKAWFKVLKKRPVKEA